MGSETVSYVATEPQPSGMLFAKGFNDRLLRQQGQLERWISYLHDNPRRLIVKREYPDLFRVRFGLEVAGQQYAAIGNQFLLSYPNRIQVQCSRSLTEQEIKTSVDDALQAARQGSVLVSPAISPGEQAIMRAALDAKFPLIFITAWGFNTFSKPEHQFYNACAEGRLLLLAPWKHNNRRIQLTREMCMSLNDMTQAICNN